MVFNIQSYLIKFKHHNAFVFNILLWCLIYVVLLFLFTKNEDALKVDYLYTLTYTVALVIPISFNLYVLIPQFLKKERYVFYFISLISLIIISVLLFESFFDQIINNLFKNYFFISYHINTSFAVILITSLIISALIKLAEDWFYFNQAQNKLVKDAHQITQSQLNALRAQINPHFLFNALNVIYAMSLEQRTDTKEAVLQLSDILRYIIYDANSNKVTLQQERELINNYIAFQKNRNAEDIQIECTSHIDNSTIEIYPMLLLPLLENAYKHCSVNVEGKHFINISINQQQDIFNFEIENSQAVGNTYNDKEVSGVGLKNVQENLKIVYPNKHQFNIYNNDVIYKVNLTIHL